MHKPPPLLRLGDVPGGPEAGTLIARLADLPTHGGKDVLFKKDELRVNVFVQRWQNDVFVYENCCPHAHTPLNLANDRFLNLSENALICRTHGALFTIEDGKCIGGPCQGQYLRAVDFEVKSGAIYSK
ncbi:MAG: Rieske 2Fe-2S domain-containing protein [Kordiimonadaceae bacterium]|nr:Rieske 2Fe-2S domain-containing protein [Kordiimonadaceae bacterium]